MSVYVESIGNQKISYRNPEDVDFSSLYEYITLAKKSISKFANRFYRGLAIQMLNDEDAISNIANAIMMADWRFDENYQSSISKTGQSKTRYSYRNQCAIWAIKSYLTKTYKTSANKKVYSLDCVAFDDVNSNGYDFIVDEKAENPSSVVEQNEIETNTKLKVDEILSLNFITEKQKEYLRLYYIENYTFDQIGKQFSLTREAIRLSVKKILQQIKEHYNEQA